MSDTTTAAVVGWSILVLLAAWGILSTKPATEAAKENKVSRYDNEYEVRDTAFSETMNRITRLIFLVIALLIAAVIGFVVIVYMPFTAIRADIGKEAFYGELLPKVEFYLNALFWLFVFGFLAFGVSWGMRRAQVSDNALASQAGANKAQFDALREQFKNEGRMLAMEQLLLKQGRQTNNDEDDDWFGGEDPVYVSGQRMLPNNSRAIGMDMSQYQ